jgi:hypothetical protein
LFETSEKDVRLDPPSTLAVRKKSPARLPFA